MPVKMYVGIGFAMLYAFFVLVLDNRLGLILGLSCFVASFASQFIPDTVKQSSPSKDITHGQSTELVSED